ncbi:DUF2202 domain-containing protein [Thermodesulfobacteriota bacterium B35]
MKIQNSITGIAGITLITGILLIPAAGDARGFGHGGGGGRHAGLSSVVAGLPMQELSTEEEVGLLRMREEEKLARDVYQALYRKWHDPVFANIIQAEQRHMDSVRTLLDKYSLSDPVTDTTVGVFTDSEIQGLYDSLVARGLRSRIDALEVGATIEDLDIRDLYDLLAKTDNTDIRIVYQNLVKGSRNHLRAFASRLSMAGVTYQAQYLTPEQISDIITSPRERGMVDENGEPVAGGRGRMQGGRLAGPGN